MEERDVNRAPGTPLLGGDAVFAQVWSRVDPAGKGPIQAVSGPPALAVLPAPETAAVQLQSLVGDCLEGAAVYRALARKGRRSARELQALGQAKLRQAKRLSAAYFLRSGVRYWPAGAVAGPDPRALFFPTLRRQLLDEGRLLRRLEELAAGERDGELQELCAALARETGDMARAVRRIAEREN